MGEIVSIFNSFFVNLGNQLASKIPQTDVNYKDVLQDPCASSQFMFPTDEIDILEIVDLKVIKAQDLMMSMSMFVRRLSLVY